MGDEGQGLQGFAEAHIVGEDSAELVAPEKHQPVKTSLLVGPKGGQNADGERNGVDGGVRCGACGGAC